MTAPRAERALDALNLFLSDVRYGLGAYLAVYLLERHAWDGASIGVALSAAAMAGLLAQAPIGVLVDKLRAKRALVAGADPSAELAAGHGRLSVRRRVEARSRAVPGGSSHCPGAA